MIPFPLNVREAVKNIMALSKPENCKVWPVIRFFTLAGVIPCDIICRLQAVYGENAMSDAHVWRLGQLFRGERTEMHDEAQDGRPNVID